MNDKIKITIEHNGKTEMLECLAAHLMLDEGTEGKANIIGVGPISRTIKLVEAMQDPLFAMRTISTILGSLKK